VLVLSFYYVAESGINDKEKSVNIFENVFKLQFSYCETLIYLNEVLTAVKIKIVIFWVIPSCSFVVCYRCFRGICCLCLQDISFYPTLKMEAAHSLEM
jgi:hypothetical protein